MMEAKRFIDPNFEDIVSQLAQDETGKRQYYRPVYSLHKWWARRPGSLFRSIILLANNSSQKLFDFTLDGSISRLSNYFNDHDFSDQIIFDPFMGGGTTLVEANRLGAKVVGCDINPVSYWIVKETLKSLDLDKLYKYFDQLEHNVGEKIKKLYRTKCVHCNAESDSLYVFWIRFSRCEFCNENSYLYKRSLLNLGLSRNKAPSKDNPATTFCPICFNLNDWHGVGNSMCNTCGSIYDPKQGTYNQGYYTCSNCGIKQQSLIKTMKAGQKLKEKLLAIEYWCNNCNERLYKSPDTADFSNIERIERTFEESKKRLIFPRQEVLEGASSVRWRLHNYNHYSDVFNARQLIAFNYLIEGIRTIPEEEYRNALITVFSNSLEYNNLMTPYNYPHRKIHHLFNYHAMPLTTTPVENVVWGIGSEGAGTFSNCFQRYIRAKKYSLKPFDKFKNASGNVQTVFSQKERIVANFVSSFDELRKTPRGALLLCGDSSNAPVIPDQSIDYIITDPPYFDNVHYSELSNFFYVWLSCLVDDPNFSDSHVPTEQEAIVNDGMDKGEKDYQNLLFEVFNECERVLKHNGKLIFTFHHTKWQAWWTVLNSIIESGFRIMDSFPVLSEYKVNPHIRNKQAMNMDLVIVCQKRCVPFEQMTPSPKEVLRRAARALPSKITHGSDNRLFLHYMGELLKTASSLSKEERVDYCWFEDALKRYDDFHTSIYQRKNELEFKTNKSLQLRLLESESKTYSSD